MPTSSTPTSFVHRSLSARNREINRFREVDRVRRDEPFNRSAVAFATAVGGRHRCRVLPGRRHRAGDEAGIGVDHEPRRQAVGTIGHLIPIRVGRHHLQRNRFPHRQELITRRRDLRLIFSAESGCGCGGRGSPLVGAGSQLAYRSGCCSAVVCW